MHLHIQQGSQLLKMVHQLRFSWLLVSIWILGSIGWQACCRGSGSEGSNHGVPPNIVFILADDLGWGDVGCYGQEKIPTPNIDRLAREGMRWTHHYSGAPVCAPARCVLMTGKHLGHAEIRGNKQAKTVFPEFDEGQLPLSPSAQTIASLLQSHGYRTGAFGKWGLGPVGSSGDPNTKGFATFFGYNCQAQAHSYYPPHLWSNAQKIALNTRPIPGHAQRDREPDPAHWQGEHYAPYRMLEAAESFLRAQQDTPDTPFFLYLPFIEPHVAMHPPQSGLDRFPREWDTKPYLGDNGYLPHARPRAAYAAMVSDLDRYVGRVLTLLEDMKLADNTLVIFTSDNGATHPNPKDPAFHVGGADIAFFQSTRHLRGHKGSVYEGGIRVPMIARFPGVIPAGTTNATPSYFADWFPTLCDVSGITKPEGLDGESLWPRLTGRTATVDRDTAMVWVFPEYGGQVAFREGRWKLVRRQLATPKPGPWELYDIDADESETHNVASEQLELVAEMSKRLRAAIDDNVHFPVRLPDDGP
jgi:arylsulfatase A-like enzyme